MKPTIKDRNALFYPQGFLDGMSAPSFFTMQDIMYTASLDIDAVLVSFEKVVFFNKKGVDFVDVALSNIKSKKSVTTGIFGFQRKNYETLLKLFPDGVPFCIFDNYETATLFLGISNFKKDSSIVFYTNDKSQKTKLSFELYNRGYQPIYIENYDEYLKRLESKRNKEVNFAHAFSMTHLVSYTEKVAYHMFGNVVVYSLGGYVDNEINQKFDIVYHQKSLAVGFRIFVFECERVKSMNIHGINFLSKLNIAAAEYGATVCIVSLRPDALQHRLREELISGGVLFFDKLDEILRDEEFIKEHSGGSKINKNSKKITKSEVENLPVFIDSLTRSLKTLSGSLPEKDKVALCGLEVTEDRDALYGASIGFYGDIDGMIFLLLSKNMTKKACKVLLGSEEEDEKELLDALSEFVNIIGGGVKTKLAEKKVRINITLPRSFATVDEIEGFLSGKTGVLVSFKLDGNAFYFFLCK